MPDLAETAAVSAVSVTVETPLHDPVTGAFLPGHRGMGGRPKGSRTAAKFLDRAAPRLARHMIARSLKSDHVLCRTMDKILPDAGKEAMAVHFSLNYAALSIPATKRSTLPSPLCSPSEPSTTHVPTEGAHE